MTRFVPHPALRGRVESIDVIDDAGGDLVVLPSTGAVLGFQFRGHVRRGATRLAPAGVTGIQAHAQTYGYARGTGSLLVRFRPEGAACLGVPAAELRDRSVALDAILPPARVAAVAGALAEARDAPARVAVVERFLHELPWAGDRLVARAVTLLADDEDASVAAVARQLGLSERQLERRFLARVGVSPKQFAALRRFERAVALAPRAASWTDAALQAGYYDQSHFIRDFRRFAGSSPARFFGSR